MASSPIRTDPFSEAQQKAELLLKLGLLRDYNYITQEQYMAMHGSSLEEMKTFYENCVAEIKRKEEERKLQFDNLLSILDPRLVVQPGETRSSEDSFALMGRILTEDTTPEGKENFRNKMNVFMAEVQKLHS